MPDSQIIRIDKVKWRRGFISSACKRRMADKYAYPLQIANISITDIQAINILFKLHELLDSDGKPGIILSNSWLGTESGRKFFNALQYYYDIETVVASDNKRWFKNAAVVVTTHQTLCKIIRHAKNIIC